MFDYNYSIIIPHKNSFDLLLKCLLSIPRREDIQVIVVDDCSDNIEWNNVSFDDDHIELIHSEQSRGAGRARNIGLERACGKWVLFADCDDYFQASFIETLDRYIESDVDVIYFSYSVVDDGLVKLPYVYNQSLINSTKDSKGVSVDEVKYRALMPWNKMVRLSFIQKHSIHFEECINGNDLFYSFQVGYYARKVAYCTEPIYNYVQHNSSLTHSKRNSDMYYLCTLNHCVKSGRFYRFIGHAQWKKSVMHKLAAILMKKGFFSFCQACKVYLYNIKAIRKDKDEFVNYFSRV